MPRHSGAVIGQGKQMLSQDGVCEPVAHYRLPPMGPGLALFPPPPNARDSALFYFLCRSSYERLVPAALQATTDRLNPIGGPD